MLVEKIDSFMLLHCGRALPLLFNVLLPSADVVHFLQDGVKTDFPLLVELWWTQQRITSYFVHQVLLHHKPEYYLLCG